MRLAEELDVQGLSVTVPHKEEILPCLSQRSDEVHAIGACNTAVRFAGGWMGSNTDARGFSDSLLDFLDKKNLKGKRLTVIGAGGAAKAVVSEIHRLGGKALVLNRTVPRARDLAVPYKFTWGSLDNRGVELMEKYRDIIIQTTPAGMEGQAAADPLVEYSFSGRELVMDLIYKPAVTPFLHRAVLAGCKILNGHDMLLRQARYQYAQFFRREFPTQLLSRVTF
jgi:3-dehydroquinate dehydratase/shikimate dehydrogenase